MQEIKSIFKEGNMNKSLEQRDLVSFKFSNDNMLNVTEKAIIYYIAYTEKSSANETCNDLLSPGKVEMNITFKTRCYGWPKQMAISRGRLTKPPDYIYIYI